LARRRSSTLTPAYSWDDRIGRYRDTSTGRFVQAAEIRRALDIVIEDARTEMRDLGQDLREGEIDIEIWQTQMAEGIKRSHLAYAALAVGGWAQMTQADFGRVGQRIRFQYDRLRRFAGQIASGAQRLDGSILRRVDLYVQATRATFHTFSRLMMSSRGFAEERNVLNPADHCVGCVGETDRGWVALGSLIPIGGRDCLTNCRCSIEYRNVTTGETRLVA
jgi:hypothetical protein